MLEEIWPQVAREAVGVVGEIFGVVEQRWEETDFDKAIFDGEVSEWAEPDATSASASFQGKVLCMQWGEVN